MFYNDDIFNDLWAVFSGYSAYAGRSYLYYIYIGGEVAGEHSFTF